MSSEKASVVSSIIVDGIVQFLFALWAKWIFFTLFEIKINFVYFWLGFTLWYVALYHHTPKGSGKFLFYHVLVLILASMIILIK